MGRGAKANATPQKEVRKARVLGTNITMGDGCQGKVGIWHEIVNVERGK